MSFMNSWPPTTKAIAVFAVILTTAISSQIIKNHWGVDINSIAASQNSDGNSSNSNQSDKLIRLGLQILTKQGYAVSEVEVIIISEGAPIRKVSDRNGYIELELPERKSVDVLLQKAGFKPTKETIDLRVDPSKTRPILLEKT
jgi:hypothetical protein